MLEKAKYIINVLDVVEWIDIPDISGIPVFV
jgi:hypothetical protein